jgi:hypothetical protein
MNRKMYIKKRSFSDLSYYPDIYLEGLRFPGPYLKPGPRKHLAQMLITRHEASVV